MYLVYKKKVYMYMGNKDHINTQIRQVNYPNFTKPQTKWSLSTCVIRPIAVINAWVIDD